MDARAPAEMKTESRNARALHESRKFSYERVAAYRARFIDPRTGRFHEHLLRRRACPVCDSEEYAEIFEKEGGTMVKCLRCSMIFLNPCFTDEALADYYRDLDSGQAEITALEDDFYSDMYNLGLDMIEALRPPGAILDVGCSSGFFLNNARSRGWATTGIDLQIREAEMARGKGHEIHTTSLAALQLPQRFDAIALWDVFEHIPDGRGFWSHLDRNLAPDGVVFLQIPNADSLAARVMREHSHMFDCLEHSNLYGPATIGLFAESVGFNPRDIRSVISEVSVLNNFLHYEDPYFGSSRYGTTVLDLLGESTIHENLLGYKLQIALTRKDG